MKTSKTGLRPAILAIAIAAFAVAFPASAAAVSGGLAPAGHTLDIGSQQVTVGAAGYTITCTMDGGTVNIPAAPNNRNATAPFAVNMAAPPTFTACTNTNPFALPVTITTSGTWRMTVQWGSASASPIHIWPATSSGINVNIGNGLCVGSPSPFLPNPAISGTWTNGVGAADSTITFQQSATLGYVGGSACLGVGSAPLIKQTTPAVPTQNATNPAGNITAIP